MHLIKRMQDYNSTLGFYVQIERRSNGKRYTVANKLFSDNVIGSTEKALEMAIKYRNEKLKEFPPRCLEGYVN